MPPPNWIATCLEAINGPNRAVIAVRVGASEPTDDVYAVPIVAGDATQDETRYRSPYAEPADLPTLSALLLQYSHVDDVRVLPKADLVAITNYRPHVCDFGMCYRNKVKFLIYLPDELNATAVVWKISRGSKVTGEVPLTEPAELTDLNLKSEPQAPQPQTASYGANDLYAFPWFDRFMCDNAKPFRLAQYYDEEFTTDLGRLLGKKSSELAHQFSRHVNPQSDAERWVLRTLYAVFAWSIQLPTWRAMDFDTSEPEAPSEGGLTGLNVSALLLDEHHTPRAWGFNTNAVNKSLHAETALCLAWLKGGDVRKSYKGYTFLSPWHSCAMCASWIAEVFPGAEVVWFVDDPGLPKTPLEVNIAEARYPHEHRATEVFLPEVLRGLRLEGLYSACFVRVLGQLTYSKWKDTLDDLPELQRDCEALVKQKSHLPVKLLHSEQYFDWVQQAWDGNRKLPVDLAKDLARDRQLVPYASNIAMLRHRVLGFDPLGNKQPYVIHGSM